MSSSKTSKRSSAESVKDALEKPERSTDKPAARFPTGCTLLDRMVAGGDPVGFPEGKIINLVGDKSSGKTFLAIELAAASRHRFGKRLKIVYDDCESGFSFDTRALYGFEVIPTDPDKRRKSKTVEELYCNVRDFLEKLKDDDVGIYIVDSLDGLTSEEGEKLADERFKASQTGKEYDKGSYKMGKAKYLSQEFFPTLAGLIEEKHALLVVISQVRENVDPMSFDRYTRAGGKALDFYCHTVLWLAQLQKIKRKERAVGVVVKAKATKSKTPRPYREMTFSLLFDYGLDDIGTSVDYLFDFRTETGKLTAGAGASWGEKATKESVTEFLKENGKDAAGKLATLIEDIEKEGGPLWEAYQARFGVYFTRDELIEYIEGHNLAEELARKAAEKWESTEAAIKTNRPPKYAR